MQEADAATLAVHAGHAHYDAGDEEAARAEYREALGMTHLIVARPRLGELPAARLTRAVAVAAELLGGS